MTTRAKILVVAESIDIEDSSGSKANVALILNLRKAGFEPIVFHYTRKKIQLEGIPCFPIKENRRSLLFFLSRTERQVRHRLKIDLHKSLEKIFGFSFTFFNDSNSIRSSLKRNLNFEPALVITLSKGGSFRPHHALLNTPLLHEKWLAYIHDPYPMHLYPRPFAWVEPGYYKKWRFIRDISEQAAFSGFPSKLLQEWMGSYFPNFLNTGKVLPHQIFKVSCENLHSPGYLNTKNFNLLHAGTLLDQRSPKGLVEAFKLFLKLEPNAKAHSKLIFVGGKNVFSSWLSTISKETSAIEVSENYVLFEQVFHMQQNTSVNVILEAKSEISPFLPGKFPHCVQADKPILLLGPNYSESRRLLGESYPYWSEIDDIERIAGLIQDLYRLWLQDEKLKLNKPDLKEYLSEVYLKETINDLLK